MLPNGWICSNCKFDNDLLTSYCRICNAYKPDWITDRYQAEVEIRRGIYLARIESYETSISRLSLHRQADELANKGFTVTPQEELFAKFYNQEVMLVKDMDIIALRTHRDELAAIAFEAKARLVATDDEARTRNAKSKTNKEWLVTADESQVNSDTVNAVKVRQARMTKMDKIKSQLLAAGIDDETVKEMVKNLERKATEKDMKAIVFNKPTTEQAVVMVKVSKPSDGEVKEPFNPSALFGK